MSQIAGQTLGGTGEGELLARLHAGEGAAFERMVREIGPRLYATAMRILHKEEDARDAVQDAFVSALRGLPSFAGDSTLSTWLHRITINACLMKLRTRRRKPERSIEELLPRYQEDGHRVVDPPDRGDRSGPGEGMDRLEVGGIVRGAIEELPENYRIVLVLRDIEGLDTLEAATVLGMSENALKTRLHRARQALRELLAPRLGTSLSGDVDADRMRGGGQTS
jgi:RNA polymerase sigma-70 factor (ECF subfamily)